MRTVGRRPVSRVGEPVEREQQALVDGAAPTAAAVMDGGSGSHQ